MKDPLLVPRSFYERWRFKITPASRSFGWGLVASGLGSVSVLIPVYQTFCALAALLSLAWFCGWLLKPKLRVSGRFPERVTAGQSLNGRFEITNLSRRPALDLAVGVFDLPEGLRQLPDDRDRTVACLPAGQSTTVTVPLQTSRRGHYELPPARAYSLFPFQLVRTGESRAALGSVLVLPTFEPIDGIAIPLGTRYQPGGIALSSNVGESPEYIGNREYVPGEPARRLDFRSWARTGTPVVREYQEEYYCRIALLLDTYVPSKRSRNKAEAERLEHAVSLAAAVADALSGGEYLVDLFAAGPELYVFQSGRHTAHFENILDILAGVDVCRRDPFETLAPAVAEELTNISAAICILLDWDDARRGLLQTIAEAGCSLKVLLVRDEPPTQPVDGEFECLVLGTESIRRGGLGTL